jgi:UDP:flavonoid glycosyltransferase YjiC (YdhE family)
MTSKYLQQLQLVMSTPFMSGVLHKILFLSYCFLLSGHPNVRAFISHGGLMGTQEAVHSGVPIVGIPLFADQVYNIMNLVSKGTAVMVPYDSITKESLSRALDAVLHDPR